MIDYYLIGERIKITRKAKRISQLKLAELTELSVSYISCIENGKKKISLRSLIAIAEVVETTVDTLLGGNQNQDRSKCRNDISILVSDCSNTERFIITEVLLALKKSLRDR